MDDMSQIQCWHNIRNDAESTIISFYNIKSNYDLSHNRVNEF